MINVNKYLNYTYEEGIERYEERIIVGGKWSLIRQLIKATHDSYNEGHAEIHNSYNRLNFFFHW